VKKILFIVNKVHFENPKKRMHYEWMEDCSKDYDIDFWGLGYYDCSLHSLKNKIDSIKPDYIYLTGRGRLQKWLPDISDIKNIPKIFVEIDSYKYDRNDSWYDQFNNIYSRQPIWEFKQNKMVDEHYFYHAHKIHVFNLNLKYGSNIKFSKKKAKKDASITYQKMLKRIKQSKTWNKTPLFRRSVSELSINLNNTSQERSGIYMIGSNVALVSQERYFMTERFKHKINILTEWDVAKYNNILRSASALVCPTGSVYGDYTPAKLFEFSASGAAVITNCDLELCNMNDLQNAVIHYTDLDSLDSKLSMDFSLYYGLASKVMLNHTHRIRYKELFD